MTRYTSFEVGNGTPARREKAQRAYALFRKMLVEVELSSHSKFSARVQSLRLRQPLNQRHSEGKREEHQNGTQEAMGIWSE
jgi:hypothetical protein